MGVRVKKVGKTKLAVKASSRSGIELVLRRLGVDPELAKGDQKLIDPTHFDVPGGGQGSRSTARTAPAKRATTKRATTKKASANGARRAGPRAR